VPTIMHALALVQRPRILFSIGLSLLFAVLVVVALSSSAHALVLTSALSHLQAVHAATQLLTSGNPPPPPLPCGGGVGTHC
jgi:hypothetical protein